MSGFEIIRSVNLNGWREDLASSLEWCQALDCPTCETQLYPMVAITSWDQDRIVHLGVCMDCGLVGYIQRPTDAAIDRYYAETWMGETVEQAIEKARGVRAQPCRDKIFDGMGIDCAMPAVDFGTGYGSILKLLWDAGLEDLHATEACPVRAAAVKEVFGVTCGELPPRCGLIASSHVFEHLANPLAILKDFAAHQNPGDKLLLWMPNFWHEPTMGVCFFWPHLWSFTDPSLIRMAAKAGYSYVRDLPGSPYDVRILFERCEPTLVPQPRPLAEFIEKLKRGLGLSSEGDRFLHWQRHGEGCAVEAVHFRAVEDQAPHKRTLLTRGFTSKSVTKCPIELRWHGELRLFSK